MKRRVESFEDLNGDKPKRSRETDFTQALAKDRREQRDNTLQERKNDMINRLQYSDRLEFEAGFANDIQEEAEALAARKPHLRKKMEKDYASIENRTNEKLNKLDQKRMHPRDYEEAKDEILAESMVLKFDFIERYR